MKKAKRLILIEMKHFDLLQTLRKESPINCFVTWRWFYFERPHLVLALLGVDCAVAMGNERTVLFSYCVLCACMTWKNSVFTCLHGHLSVHINKGINPPPPQP